MEKIEENPKATTPETYTYWWEYLFSKKYKPRYSRLKGDLEAYECLLRKRVKETEANKHPWAEQAWKLLGKTRNFLYRNHIDEGWKSLHTAMRLEIYGMNDKERTALADSLRIQAQTGLNEYCKKVILSLLGENKPDVAPDPAVLEQAAQIRDQYYNDLYYQNRLLRNLFKLLFVLLFFCVMGLVAYFTVMVRCYGNNFAEIITMRGMIMGVFLFGLLGAITSAILFTRNLPASSRKVEIGINEMVTLSKLFIGVAFSLFVFALLRSSFLGAIELFNFDILGNFDFYAIAFVSGFSERFAQNAVIKIVGKDESAAK